MVNERDRFRHLCNPQGSSHTVVGTQLIDQNSSISHHLGNEDAHGTMEASQ